MVYMRLLVSDTLSNNDNCSYQFHDLSTDIKSPLLNT